MARKWKPSRSQRKAFAIRMQDPKERTAYEARKAERAEKRRSTSNFDYESAGGYYIPTQIQHNAALNLLGEDLTPKEKDACNFVVSGYVLNEKVHHDYIHIVNEMVRNEKLRVNEN